jgi:hypothetical protein
MALDMFELDDCLQRSAASAPQQTGAQRSAADLGACSRIYHGVP